MPRTRCVDSQRLRASQALPLAVFIVLAVFFGTPGRHDHQEAKAQPPTQIPPPRPLRSQPDQGRRPCRFRCRARSRISTYRGRQKGEVAAKSAGCLSCHKGQHEPHGKPETVRLGCIDCHGGNPGTDDLRQAHVWPRFPDAWRTSGNPIRSYTLLNHESPEFIRFVNPGDLRVAHMSCGNCHAEQVLQVRKSMMTHGAMLWGAALYNNGSVPFKWARFGESYSMNGAATADADGAAADALRNQPSKASWPTSTRCHGTKPLNPVTSCGSSSAAGGNRRRSASPTRSRIRVSPRPA